MFYLIHIHAFFLFNNNNCLFSFFDPDFMLFYPPLIFARKSRSDVKHGPGINFRSLQERRAWIAAATESIHRRGAFHTKMWTGSGSDKRPLFSFFFFPPKKLFVNFFGRCCKEAIIEAVDPIRARARKHEDPENLGHSRI